MEISEKNGNQEMLFNKKEKCLLRISSVTDLSVPSVVMDQIFPILNGDEFPEDFGNSKLMHDPSIVAYFLKQLYEEEANRETLYSGMEDIFRHMTKEEMYNHLSELSLMELFGPVEIEEWKHAYSSHLLMHVLVTENGFHQLRYLVPLMLIHDIGKQVLHSIVPEISREIVELAQKQKLPRSIAENQLLELTHAEAGARLLKEWHFPPRFYLPVKYHHSIEIPMEYILETALIQFVNWVDCNVRGIPAQPLDRKTMELAGIEEIDTEYWIRRHRKIVAEIDHYFEPEGIMNKTKTEEKP